MARDKYDYTTIKEGGPGETPRTNPENIRWWDEKEDKQVTDGITQSLRIWRDRQEQRLHQMTVSARLYGNAAVIGLAGLDFSRAASVQPGLRDRITYNVVQSAIDAVIAKISKNRPKPLFLTSGGDYRAQRKAKKLNRFVDGVFHECETYTKGLECFRDGAVWGDGLLHVYAKDERVAHERVMPNEIWLDEQEAVYGHPCQLHRCKMVDRSQAIGGFPKAKDKLLDTASFKMEDGARAPSPDRTLSDLITLRESWKLPSYKGAKDGRHLVTTENAVLLDEKWERDRFPFARFPWCKRLWGYWSQGAAEQIQNIQLEINKLLWVIQRSHHLAGSYKVFIENGSRVVDSHINNEFGTLIKYTGTKPEYATPPIVQPEIYQHLQVLVNRAYEQVGVSMLSAAAKKPAGLDSGKALREYNDIESDRFEVIGTQYANFFLDVARLSIQTARDIAEAA